MAHERPRLFVQLLARILPAEIRVEASIEVREHVRTLFAGAGSAREVIDAISVRRHGRSPAQAAREGKPAVQLAELIAGAAQAQVQAVQAVQASEGGGIPPADESGEGYILATDRACAPSECSGKLPDKE